MGGISTYIPTCRYAPNQAVRAVRQSGQPWAAPQSQMVAPSTNAKNTFPWSTRVVARLSKRSVLPSKALTLQRPYQRITNTTFHAKVQSPSRNLVIIRGLLFSRHFYRRTRPNSTSTLTLTHLEALGLKDIWSPHRISPTAAVSFEILCRAPCLLRQRGRQCPCPVCHQSYRSTSLGGKEYLCRLQLLMPPTQQSPTTSGARMTPAYHRFWSGWLLQSRPTMN